jgi:hypothetical protein
MHIHSFDAYFSFFSYAWLSTLATPVGTLMWNCGRPSVIPLIIFSLSAVKSSINVLS